MDTRMGQGIVQLVKAKGLSFLLLIFFLLMTYLLITHDNIVEELSKSFIATQYKENGNIPGKTTFTYNLY